MENKKKNNSKLLVILVSVMSVVCIGVLSVIGVIVYKGYASENDSVLNTESMITTEDTYYILINSYITKATEFSKVTYSTIQNNSMNDSNESELENAVNEFLLYSKSFTAVPYTDNDKLMNDIFLDVKYNAETMAEYTLHYITKKEDVYKNLQKDYFDNFRIDVKLLAQIEEKYYK